MPWGVAAAAVTAAGAAYAADSASNASDAQVGAAQAGLGLQEQQFNQMSRMLEAYRWAGEAAVSRQRSLLGINGPDAQAHELSVIQNSPTFGALVKQGEDAILQNASATGGLRGGNIQGALAQFRPSMLQALIDQQYSRLGGLTNIGENAAAMTGNAGQAMANSSATLLGQMGAAQAGGALAQGRAFSQGINGISNAFGVNAAMNSGGGGNGIVGYYGTGTQLNNNYSDGGASVFGGAGGQFFTPYTGAKF